MIYKLDQVVIIGYRHNWNGKMSYQGETISGEFEILEIGPFFHRVAPPGSVFEFEVACGARTARKWTWQTMTKRVARCVARPCGHCYPKRKAAR